MNLIDAFNQSVINQNKYTLNQLCDELGDKRGAELLNKLPEYTLGIGMLMAFFGRDHEIDVDELPENIGELFPRTTHADFYYQIAQTIAAGIFPVWAV